ncbi:MAG: hypothetical protein IKU55_06075 [Clostridia bacterium]|nr:hypothetical protein [Clostridia bacterium]
MPNTLGASLRNLKWVKTQKNRMVAILLVLSLLVSLDVFWALRQPGLTLAGDASCGILEHTHDEDCGMQVCICTESEDMHVHSDACFETRVTEACENHLLICTQTEDPHTHNESCYEIVTITPASEVPVLQCALDVRGHAHDDTCYATEEIPAHEETVLLCTVDDESHEHDDTCFATEWVETYTEQHLICEQTEDEHVHDAACYTIEVIPAEEEAVLICALETEPHQHGEACFITEYVPAQEETVQICGYVDGVHTHDESCYEWVLTCELGEHVHSIDCYSDVTADVETMLDWQEMFADYPFTGSLREDLVGIAQMQVGYTESERNYEVGVDGIRRGYTRYGAWYGTPYKDWSTMFVSFCLSYAGAGTEETPTNTGASAMAALWRNLDKFAEPTDYTPVSGDLVFLADSSVGIVTAVQAANFCLIRGDVDNAVCRETMALSDPSILGWGLTEGTLAVENEVDSTESTEPTESIESTELTEPTDSDASTESTESIEPIDLFDISNGPAIFIFVGSEADDRIHQEPQMQLFSLRSTGSTVTDLLPYLEGRGGTYFFTILDQQNQELPKDANGNYVVQADTNYKLTISFTSPQGFKPGTYQYQTPYGLLVDGGEGTIVLKDGVLVGSWTVTNDGLVTLMFNDKMNNLSDITISATLGIHFPVQDEPIDFDGKITVTIEKPPVELPKTDVFKWGSQGNPDSSTKNDPSKIYWTVYIVAHEGSHIPGNTLTDRIISDDYLGAHHYTESDMAAGLTIGISEYDPITGAAINWHSFTVYPGDPGLTWTETGWSYEMPETAICAWCGEITLGNKGWDYYVEYSSTPKPSNVTGGLGYMNHVTIDGQGADGWAEFSHGEILAEVFKQGKFLSDAAGGAFHWEFQAIIPGMREGQKAEYHWYVMDYMEVRDTTATHVAYVNNDAHSATVTASCNGTTINVPKIQEVTDADPFAWDPYWSADHGDGIYYGRQLNIMCRCHCTEENCQFWSDGRCESAYWYEADDGYWYTNGFCQCWTETENTVFTFTYETEDLSALDAYGGLGYYLRNDAVLYNMIILPNGSLGGAQLSHTSASVLIPGVFSKALTQDFDGYTANYKITVNEAKLVLTDGSPLTIHDVMSETLAFVSGSLVVTAEDALGNVTKLEQGTDYTVSYDGTGSVTDATGKSVHVLDIVILRPQPMMYLLDYDTTLIIPTGTTQAIKYTNSAAVTLWGKDITDVSAEKTFADINISSKSYHVRVYKTDSLTGEPLSNAIFGLYNEQGGLITTDATNANGEITFQTDIIDGIILREHVLYYMQELKAPAGYQLDSTKHWFCFCGDETDFCTECEAVLAGTDATRIPHNQFDRIEITNELTNYNLPATGGPGISHLILVGTAMIAVPLVYGFFRWRKRERRHTE